MNKKNYLFIFLCLIFCSLLLTACLSDNEEVSNEDTNRPSDQQGENGSTDEANAETGQEYRQSPMLDDQDLPPVEERLPLQPKVENQIPLAHLEQGEYEIGEYGGTMRVASLDPEWNADLFIMFNDGLLNTPAFMGEEITPNILEDFKMSDDGKEFTFYMREGMKWSDGTPVTTEDVRFTIEDVILNEELTPTFPVWLRAGGLSENDPMEYEIIDEYTFTISFSEAYGRFPIQLALTGWKGYTELIKPAHYLKPFHSNYVSLEDLEPLIEEAGFEPGEWSNLFHDKDVTNWSLTQSKAIGFPVLYPWIMVSSTENIKVYERNPYYWKIDAAGNQLPYIDQIRNEYVQDQEMMTQKVIAGELDYVSAQATLNNVPLYREYADRAGIKVPLLKQHLDPTVLFFNQTYDDPSWREVVQDQRFRKAVSFALDRQEIIEAVYYGFGVIPQLIPSEYNPDEANRLLDEMGMDQRGSDGYRLAPDGSPFEIPFESGSQAPDINPVMELVTEMLKEIGLNTSMKTIDSSLWGTRRGANELQATIFWSVQPMWRSGGWLDFAPEGLEGSLWRVWFNTKGEEGEEPPEEIKRLYELSELIMTVYPGSVEDQAYYDEIYQIHKEGLYMIPVAEQVNQPIVVAHNMGNVPIDGPAVAVSRTGVSLYFKE